MALMPIIQPASLASEVPDYGVANIDFEDDEDKGKGVVIEESGDDERADWIDWDRNDEDMRENEEWVADSEDDLYDGDESVDYNEDDECFDENVDKEAEWAGILQDDFEYEMRFDSDDHIDDDSPDEFIAKNSNEDNVAKAPVFCPDDTFDPRFALGMKFSHKKEFWGAVHSHAITKKRNRAITKNDKRRVYARCKSNGCSWHINVLRIKDELDFQIREYNHVHNCGASFNVKNLRINWLSQRYVEAFRSDPNISVKAVKKGFLSECRPFIGVDGCHLKGPHGGVLLTAVDKQKGLLPAFDKVLPGVENRFCLRHLHDNMKTAGFKGLGYKKAVWFVAKTTTVSQFQKAMQDIADLDVRCLEWLQDKPASQWSKSHFSTYLKSDDIHYEIQCFDGARYTVDLKEKTCSCRSWDLTDTFCKVYAPAFMPLDGLEMWEKAGYIPLVPSSFGRKRGRPTRARRLEPDEVRKGKKPGKEIQKMPRQKGKMICRFCHQVGHNTKGCKWKKFAEEFPVDDVFKQAAETEQHETTPVQQDEVIVNEYCPLISQPEEVS
ncbi:UNVERIFIED_CONTAM: hypothetical protein Scaly_0072000 [Sesamum calycinum]|uniref:SWIM-type domain-containing protein n=1 Tax=Sesamum calycinum TaxID=2727403 RepID=A0AAW2SXH2_9LAMI